MNSLRGDDRGAVMILTAVALVALIGAASFVVDVGSWWMHKRHLQNQVDAGALAGAGVIRYPGCSDSLVSATAAQYAGVGTSGVNYNKPADAGIKSTSVTWALNQGLADTSPCSSGTVDVTAYENNPPWWLHLPAMGSKAFSIRAHARVQLRQMTTSTGSLPIGVPDVRPKAARAWIVNEATGAVLASTTLTQSGTAGGLATWGNAANPLSVKFDSADVKVGVIVALSGATAVPTCGQPLVTCYDATTASGGMPTSGLSYLRGWTSVGTGAQNSGDGKPVLGDVRLVPSGCSDPGFAAPTTSCTYGVKAVARFGAGVDPISVVGATMTVKAGGASYPMTYDATAKAWNTATTIPLAASAGPVPVTIDWTETKGTMGTGAKAPNCNSGSSNKCTGSFENGDAVQRAFSAITSRSGPIQGLQVLRCQALNADGSCKTAATADSFERCSAAQTACTYPLVLSVAVKGSLQNAATASDPVVALRIVGGSQNQSLDCDKDVSRLADELAYGCQPKYARNTGTAACPNSPSTLWSTAQPWSCVALQTGSATNQVPEGMNTRILGSSKPSSCTAPNHWSQFPDLPAGDPRILQLFITPFGSFDGSGSGTVPVTDFAAFYVTGWTASGNGFDNPCQGNGDDAVPGNDAGYIVGHFIKYIDPNFDGGGTAACDIAALSSCVAVMTQ
ncbi:MAG TPA: pilus assembly protein TadG-related protein [Baekduia sp.]|nr:pilus assembly protein TadG-related protein [Baekduia sp.]